MTDDENHYTELQEVYRKLIDKREESKSTYRRNQKGREVGLLEAISEIEELLNEWHDRDDRDGD